MKMMLDHNKDEEKFVQEVLDSLLKKRRGYVFQQPKKNDAVVFIISGGLDSTTTMFRVLNEFRCSVYPLYVKRGARAEKSELESINYYLGEFRARFGDLVKDLKIINAEIPPTEIKKHMPKKRLSKIGHPMRNAMLQSYGIQYATAVSYEEKISIKTVYCAISPDDTLPHCSLVACRTQTIMACIDAGDWDWQVTSPMLEDTLWGIVHKVDAINYAEKHNLSLRMTHTCTQQAEIACGVCPECHLRLDAFKEAGVVDPAEYESIS